MNGQENGTVGIFKLVDGDGEAVRTNVKLGRDSVNTIEVLQGLNVGDKSFFRICRPGTASTGFGCVTGECNGGEWTADQARRRHEGIPCG